MDYWNYPFVFLWGWTTVLLMKLPHCEKNEAKSKDFIRKFHKFSNNQFQLAISWNARKLSSLFNLKDKHLYLTCKICYGKISVWWELCWGKHYIGESRTHPAYKKHICLIDPCYEMSNLITKLGKILEHCLLVLWKHLWMNKLLLIVWHSSVSA